MHSDLIATLLVVRVVRLHLDRTSVFEEPEMVRRLFMGKTHSMVAARINACVLRQEQRDKYSGHLFHPLIKFRVAARAGPTESERAYDPNPSRARATARAT